MNRKKGQLESNISLQKGTSGTPATCIVFGFMSRGESWKVEVKRCTDVDWGLYYSSCIKRRWSVEVLVQTSFKTNYLSDVHVHSSRTCTRYLQLQELTGLIVSLFVSGRLLVNKGTVFWCSTERSGVILAVGVGWRRRHGWHDALRSRSEALHCADSQWWSWEVSSRQGVAARSLATVGTSGSWQRWSIILA